MKTFVIILAFLVIASVAFAQEQQYDGQQQYESYGQQQAAAVSPQWFFPHPFFFMPHRLPFHHFPYFHHMPFPHFPSLSPMSAPDVSSNPPPTQLPCEDDIRSFFSTHQFTPSSSCCSALSGIKIPRVQWLFTQYCSGASAPSA